MSQLDGDIQAMAALWPDIPGIFDRAIQEQQLRNQQSILTQLGVIMASLSELQAAVAAERTVVESAVTLLAGISERIAALELNQEAIDALAAEVKDQAADLGAAVANGPT
jgi:hypothetical protein